MRRRWKFPTWAATVATVAVAVWLLVLGLAALAGPRSRPPPPREPAPATEPADAEDLPAIAFPATRLPDAPPEAAERIDAGPVVLRGLKARGRRRRRRGPTLMLRFYRDAAGDLLPRLDCLVASDPEHGLAAELVPGAAGVWSADATLSDARGRPVLDLELSGVLCAGHETFDCRCKVVQLRRGSMTRATSSTVTLRCQVYRLPRGLPTEAVTLRSPLATAVPAPRARGDPRPPVAVVARLVVPPDAPADLAVGAWCASYHGAWFRTPARPLGPGTHDLHFPVDAAAPLVSEPPGRTWSAATAQRTWEAGLAFASGRESRSRIAIERLALVTGAAPAATAGRILDLEPDPPDLATGTRWECRFRPDPLPPNPFVPELFAADLEVTGPDGIPRRYPAFHRQPMRLRDRGDVEEPRPDGPAHFAARFRPRQPGVHRCRLLARWRTGTELAWPLPELEVTGPPWDDYVRVDQADPRFFSTGAGTGRSSFHWPAALNLRSVNDRRGQAKLATRLTPDRGLAAYRAYLDRLAAAGGGLTEVWMAGWNLALEWNDTWPGYGGIGIYHQGNAERLDRLLDHAWSRGIRVLLVVNNHGQASARCDREWSTNPWNSWNGGPLDEAADFFRDPAALAGQHRLRRYLVGRYADHPAVFGWKVFSEINLTALAKEDRVPWHRQAAADYHRLDHYDHPVTSHWSGTYRTPCPEICALPEMDFIAIDAYHGNQVLLAKLLVASTAAPDHGLGRFGKPVITTEYGGGSGATDPQRLLADHLTGALAAFVGGHGAGPLLWWYEWVDQGDRWKPLGAARNFVAGEDPRGDPGPMPVVARAPGAAVWAAAWRGEDRHFLYAVDAAWATSGETPETVAGTVVRWRDPLPPGRYRVEWWDPDEGRILATDNRDAATGFDHLALPAFVRHLAAKVIRLEG